MENTDMAQKEIARCMRLVTSETLILNSGSFALTLLWKIYEDAEEHIDVPPGTSWPDDGLIEEMFKKEFPVFVAEYPKVMILDT